MTEALIEASATKKNQFVALLDAAQQGQLPMYEAACVALAEAVTTDEVVEIRSRAEAIRAYARQAKNKDLEIQAAEIRIRALRRLGQLVNAVRIDGQIEPPAGNETRKEMKKSRWKRMMAGVELGLSQNLSVAAIGAARPTEDQYENLLKIWKERCIAENRVYTAMRIFDPFSDYERKADRSARHAPPPPPLPPTLFDEALVDSIYHEYCAIGDISVHRIDESIQDLTSDLIVTVSSYATSIRMLRNIRDHFGGGLMPRRDGSPIEIRDVLSEEKLLAFRKLAFTIPTMTAQEATTCEEILASVLFREVVRPSKGMKIILNSGERDDQTWQEIDPIGKGSESDGENATV